MSARQSASDRALASGDPRLLAALGSPAMYPAHPAVTVHETHASWVFVAGGRAYKLKKPVSLGFLDYSTPELRRRACVEEVRVNKPLAPELYLGVRALVPSGQGFRLAGEEERGAVDYVVEMRSFREQDSFAALAGADALSATDVEAVARFLADFHRAAEIVEDWGPERVLASWLRNVSELHAVRHPSGWALDVALGFGTTFVEAHAHELRERGSSGLARDGHGDLRCEHVLTRPVRIVDRIEFDPRLRGTDVAADLAFLAMDLEACDQRWAADALYEAYRRTGLDLGGAWLRSFYAAHWALVRTKVALIAAAEHEQERQAPRIREATQLWELSERLCWRARRPLAVVVCGPAASGKSVLARALSARAELPVVSSDAVRKRLAGIAPTQPASAEHYTAEFTRVTYERVAVEARAALDDDGGAIVDATCRSRRQREPLLSALRGAGAPVVLVRCEVPLELALERVAARQRQSSHVSDATAQIVERQFREFEEPRSGEADVAIRLDTAAALDEQLAELARAADRAAAGR